MPRSVAVHPDTAASMLTGKREDRKHGYGRVCLHERSKRVPSEGVKHIQLEEVLRPCLCLQTCRVVRVAAAYGGRLF